MDHAHEPERERSHPRTATPTGLHEFLVSQLIAPRARPGMRCLDLGCGAGALCARLAAAGLGLETLAADSDVGVFRGEAPFRQVDCNTSDFAGALGRGRFDLVLAVEVIEHVESAIGFLRNVAELLRPGGDAILTTPNVDSVPARLKFLLRGKLRMFDEAGDPTHVTPVFLDLMQRHYVPRSGLSLVAYRPYPGAGFQLTRPWLASVCRALAPLLGGGGLLGDHHIFVLRRAD